MSIIIRQNLLKFCTSQSDWVNITRGKSDLLCSLNETLGFCLQVDSSHFCQSQWWIQIKCHCLLCKYFPCQSNCFFDTFKVCLEIDKLIFRILYSIWIFFNPIIIRRAFNLLDSPRTWVDFKAITNFNLLRIFIINHHYWWLKSISMSRVTLCFYDELKFSWLGNYVLTIDVLAEPILFDLALLPSLHLKPVLVNVVVNDYWYSIWSYDIEYTEDLWDLNFCHLSIIIHRFVNSLESNGLVSTHHKLRCLPKVLTRIVGAVRECKKAKFIFEWSSQIDWKDCVFWCRPSIKSNMTFLVCQQVWFRWVRLDKTWASNLPVGWDACEFDWKVNTTC